ncbi:Hydroxyacylglutathione hydrolase [bacterium YEK0313]|nr:Hydroxyacylglutathione hydrolase [bacterium YEK0313]
MSALATDPDLVFPVPTPPEPGAVLEIAPGILWTRLPLPFRLNHVNIYLIEDGDGWAVLDTGIDDQVTRDAWEALVAGPLKGRRLTRLIVTHFHPDHIGLAGWLARRFDMPLLTSQTSYLSCLNISLKPNALDAKLYRDFYLSHGLGQELTELVATQGSEYLHMVSDLPGTFLRLVAGDQLKIGGRVFAVRSGDGHAAEQIMLHSAEDKVLFVADQVLAKITPNVSVWAVDPHGDPLGLFLRSLRLLKAEIPPDTLVLPGHQLPFIGLDLRSQQLIAHHESRCAALIDACRDKPRSAAELIPFMFTRKLDAHQTSFAFSEVLSHVNYTLNQGELVRAGLIRGVEYFAAPR